MSLCGNLIYRETLFRLKEKSLYHWPPKNQTDSGINHREQIWPRRSPCLEAVWERESLPASLGSQATSGLCLEGHMSLLLASN